MYDAWAGTSPYQWTYLPRFIYKDIHHRTLTAKKNRNTLRQTGDWVNNWGHKTLLPQNASMCDGEREGNKNYVSVSTDHKVWRGIH